MLNQGKFLRLQSLLLSYMDIEEGFFHQATAAGDDWCTSFSCFTLCARVRQLGTAELQILMLPIRFSDLE